MILILAEIAGLSAAVYVMTKGALFEGLAIFMLFAAAIYFTFKLLGDSDADASNHSDATMGIIGSFIVCGGVAWWLCSKFRWSKNIALIAGCAGALLCLFGYMTGINKYN